MESNGIGAMDSEKILNINTKLALETRIRNEMNWFYLIAGVSLINSVLYLLGLKLTFVVGLGFAQIIDGISAAASADISGVPGLVIRILGFGLVLLLSGIFLGFGLLGRKKNKPAILIGMVLYLFDGLLLLLSQDWFAAIFHGFALLGIFQGYQAIHKLGALEINGPIEIPESIRENIQNKSKIPAKTSTRWILICLCLLVLVFVCIGVGIPLFSK